MLTWRNWTGYFLCIDPHHFPIVISIVWTPIMANIPRENLCWSC